MSLESMYSSTHPLKKLFLILEDVVDIISVKSAGMPSSYLREIRSDVTVNFINLVV